MDGIKTTDWRTVSDRTKRAAVYARYSTAGQSDKSTQDQIREAYAAAARHGLVITHLESDEATRARAWARRHGMRRLLEAAKRGEYGVLIVENTSRFARQALKGSAQLSVLEEAGVRILDCLTGQLLDLCEPMHVQMMQNALTWAEMETRARAQMVRRGHVGVVARGCSTGGRPPLGFIAVADHPDQRQRDVRWKRDPATAPVAQRMFEMADQGISARRIGRHPEIARAILARQTKKLTRNFVSPQTILSLLRNEAFVGRRVWGKVGRTGKLSEDSGRNAAVDQPEERRISVDGFCEQIIPTDLWDRVQKRLDESAAAYGSKVDNHKSEKQHIANPGRGYLCSGLIKCASCGFAYVLNSGGKNRAAYYCATRKLHGKNACDNKVSVFQATLEAKLKHTLESLVKNPDALKDLVEEHNESIIGANESQLAIINGLQAQMQDLLAKQGRLVDAIADGGAAHKVLLKKLGDIETEITAINTKITEAKGRVQPLLQVRPLSDYETGDAPLFSGDRDRDRALLHDLVSRIDVYPGGQLVMHMRGPLATVTQVMFEAKAPNLSVADARAKHWEAYDYTADMAELRDAEIVPGGMVAIKDDGIFYALKTMPKIANGPDALEGAQPVLDNVSDPTGNRTRDCNVRGCRPNR